ncbi:MAG TPA: Ig-like domain-containing protein [Verrucomicrobiota bacterium]|mgnify:FL=1|nr:Ig-like domain-containing protein [Verrucomicrobiota bacterium]
MKKILFVLIGVLVSHICFAQSSLVVIYDNTYNDKLTTFQISNGEFVGDEIIMDTDTRPPYNINYFSFTYWEQNFNGNEQMKVLFYENNGTDGQPSTVLWDSGLFDLLKPDNQVPDTTYKYQVIFDENSGISANVGQQNFTWAVTLSGLDTGESAGLWIYSPPTVGKNYDDYWYKPNDTSPWELRRGAQPGAQPIDFEATVKALNFPPDVSVTAPADGAKVVAGSTVTLTATATDPDGWIQKIEFYVDGEKIGEDSTPPSYSIVWVAGLLGDYEIKAMAYDNLNQSNESAISTIQVVANTAPSFTKGNNISVPEDSGPQIISGWATDIIPGPDYESGQELTFIVEVENDNSGLFLVQPSISPDGTLTFESAPDSNGVATVTVVLKDDGGTIGDGKDTSEPQTFTITITAVNDAPVAKNVFANVQEDTQTDIELDGCYDVDGDPLTFIWVSGPSHGTVSISGSIATYIPDLDYNGIDSFTYKVHDGSLYSEPATVTITVIAVNDVKPSYFSPATIYQTEVNPVAVVIGDFIRDGRKDVAVACAESRSVVLFKAKAGGEMNGLIISLFMTRQ